MASKFDMYENDMQTIISSKTPSSPFDDDEVPMFQKVKAKFDPPEKITHLVTAQNYKVLAMANNVLLRVDQQRQKNDSVTEIDLNRMVPGVKLVGLFLDPTGDHLLISFSTELLYMHKKHTKPRPVGKMKGHEVTAVAWHPPNSGIPSDSSTRPILLGTAKGEIYEMQISPEQDSFIFQSSDLYCKRVFDMGQKKGLVITGLEFYKMEKSDHYFVIASTQEFLYHYVGRVNNIDDRPLLQPLFNQYISSTVEEKGQYLPGKLETSRLQLYRDNAREVPYSVCWQSSLGIYFVQINHASPEDLLSTNSKIYHFPTEITPISFLKTEFHILLLYHDHIEGISLLSENIVFKDYFDEMYGPLVNICKDLATGKILVYAQQAIYKYDVHEEDRHVWLIYAEKGEYEIAKMYCKNDVYKRDKVLKMQADYHFNNKEYERSAEYYAETQASFEKIALKFLEVENNEALKLFLKNKLKGLKPNDKAHMTMLVLWIIEILLSQLNEMKTKGKDKTKEYIQLQQELDEFLINAPSKECILKNRQAVYGLMSSHGDQENLMKIAKSTGDYDKVITHHLNKGESHEALEILIQQVRNKKIWYQYIPSLLQEQPIRTLSTLRTMGRDLDPMLILPSLIAESNSCPDEMIKYLEYCTNDLNCMEQPIHNFLLYLLAQYRPEKLMTYLRVQGEELSMVNYDVRYGFRLCRQFDRKEACVKLSSLLGLWESAVELALSVSTQLAIYTVQSSHCSPSLRRKLWLNIAKHVVTEQKEDSISQVMKFLKQCDLIKIEDILPFFPDYPTIDYFKDAICSSLQEYNQHIEDLKEEMQDATKSAEIIRNEIQSFRTRHTIIEWNTNCYICNLQLLLRPFYAFPCGHFFHYDCLLTDLKPLLPQKQKENLQSLQRQASSQITPAEKEKVKNQIDSILAAQCLYCGDIMIDLIDKPFIKDEDYERLKKEWE